MTREVPWQVIDDRAALEALPAGAIVREWNERESLDDPLPIVFLRAQTDTGWGTHDFKLIWLYPGDDHEYRTNDIDLPVLVLSNPDDWRKKASDDA
ncbi:hypothetical protein IU451_28745 [Nocardia cyriacigeorgica]|uniref:hypothetical protein n=1 Tax=Nocardia cyriacigeorgica TaxID=135487 RepID=UPI0018932784|nr:hypothetical protein [Nocardia cyriacigeorgica]MBF6326491.1 hypothetical protein [Nocardia cyriacigeorgica]